MSKAMDEFFRKLRKTPRRWALTGDAIRTTTLARHCPITAAANSSVGASYYAECGRRLGLTEKEITSIVVAADLRISLRPDLLPLRKKLLRACGLKENAT